VGPLLTSAGYTHCLTAVDHFTRWPEVVPILDITADTVARALLIGLTSRLGCLQAITTNQGCQFESQLFHSLAKLCGIPHSRTTAHHPTANRLLEHFHQKLKAAIMCHADQHWTMAHPLVLLGICMVFKEDLQASVAELVYGEPLADSQPSESSTPHHRAPPTHGPPQTSSGSTPCLPGYIHAQRPQEVHACLPPSGHNAPGFGAPLPGPVMERRHFNSSCVAGRSPCQPTDSSRPTCWMRLTAEPPPPLTLWSAQPWATAPPAALPRPIARTTHSGRQVRFRAHIKIWATTSTGGVMWEPPTLNQALVDKCRPRQLQCPLVYAPLATTYKDADLRYGSRQSQYRNHPLLRNSSAIRFQWKWIGTKHSWNCRNRFLSSQCLSYIAWTTRGQKDTRRQYRSGANFHCWRHY
jgi:hypothetical protein